MPQQLKTDGILFGTVVAMTSFGLLILYSASSINSEMNEKLHSPLFFISRQLAFAVVAVGVMMWLKKTPYRKFQKPAVAFGAVGIVLLLLLLAIFVDPHRRWLRYGPLSLQPSELAKPALVIFLAFFVTWRGRAINNWRYTLVPAAVATGLVIFAVVVADLGTAVVLATAAMTVFFVAGLEWKYFAIVIALGLAGVAVFIWIEPYRLGRVVGFFDDKNLSRTGRISPRLKAYIESAVKNSIAPTDSKYQQEQAKIAVGEGGPLGMGLMEGRQKLLYLPEPHNDFIYAVAAEEMGLIGSVGLLAGFVVIFWRGMRATVRMRDDFGRYLALGATISIVVQAFINMSVVLSMMPTKGIPLPMISYGGSSLLSTLALLGILMNVSEHAG